MKIYKYVPLHFVIRHHSSRLSWAFNFSYCWLLRCVTRSRYHPRASVGIPDVGNAFYHRPIFEVGGRRPTPLLPLPICTVLVDNKLLIKRYIINNINNIMNETHIFTGVSQWLLSESVKSSSQSTTGHSEHQAFQVS